MEKTLIHMHSRLLFGHTNRAYMDGGRSCFGKIFRNLKLFRVRLVFLFPFCRTLLSSTQVCNASRHPRQPATGHDAFGPPGGRLCALRGASASDRGGDLNGHRRQRGIWEAAEELGFTGTWLKAKIHLRGDLRPSQGTKMVV